MYECTVYKQVPLFAVQLWSSSQSEVIGSNWGYEKVLITHPEWNGQ